MGGGEHGAIEAAELEEVAGAVEGLFDGLVAAGVGEEGEGEGEEAKEAHGEGEFGVLYGRIGRCK